MPTTNESRPTATIIPFPVDRRKAGRSSSFMSKAGAGLEAWPSVDCGAGWYHEAALRDAERARRS